MSGYGASHSGGVRGMMGALSVFSRRSLCTGGFGLALLTIAHPFFVSGQTKVEGPSVGKVIWLAGLHIYGADAPEGGDLHSVCR